MDIRKFCREHQKFYRNEMPTDITWGGVSILEDKQFESASKEQNFSQTLKRREVWVVLEFLYVQERFLFFKYKNLVKTPKIAKKQDAYVSWVIVSFPR